MTVDPDSVPWDRVVHFFGRATDVPAAVAKLDGDDHRVAESFLMDNLEHQDGVMQATPLAVRLILRALAEGRVRDPRAVRAILERIERAARFQLEGSAVQQAIKDWSLYSPERLWPPFISEEEDFALWEELDTPEEEWLGWSHLTLSLLEAGGWRER